MASWQVGGGCVDLSSTFCELEMMTLIDGESFKA
jgi:hypothetical protein